MLKFTFVPALAFAALFTGCQTHDRVAYNPEPAPIRSNSVKLAGPRPLSGGTLAPADANGALLPELSPTGLDTPSLIP